MICAILQLVLAAALGAVIVVALIISIVTIVESR
jgi:hypothetical protein